jgi:hypothetical protein
VVGVLVDLSGPKIRLGRVVVGAVHWRAGDHLRVTLTDVTDTHDRVSVTYAGLAAQGRKGDCCWSMTARSRWWCGTSTRHCCFDEEGASVTVDCA